MKKFTPGTRKILKTFSIFLIFSLGLAILYLSLSMTDFLWEGFVKIPPILFVVYAVGSAIALVATLIAKKNGEAGKKAIVIGSLFWFGLTVILAISYIIVTNWQEFTIRLARLLPIEFIFGFLCCLGFIGFSIFICYLLDKSWEKK